MSQLQSAGPGQLVCQFCGAEEQLVVLNQGFDSWGSPDQLTRSKRATAKVLPRPIF